MSFATLSNTLDDCSAISTLNVTKNPFDSAQDGRLNLPALSASPSIFLQQDTPGSQKKKGFRWSIDQISKLNPADIDEFPHQEYSSTCERPEDEEKVQKAINEYFSHGTILPSPWTPENHVKHVTFSPHPPSTTYISGDEESVTEASHASSPPNSPDRRNSSDVCCQTSLTFPPSFDLSKIVDSGFYSYVEEEGNSASKDLNVSSLRRKLFSPEENHSPMTSRDRKLPSARVTRSILKSPSPINLLTSSPVQHRNVKIRPDSNSPLSKDANSLTSESPAVSPIKAQVTTPDEDSPHGMSRLTLDGTLSNDDVFSNDVLESSNVDIESKLIPDVSPIKLPETNNALENFEDDGPMKLSDLSHVSMELESKEGNLSSIEMEIAESQPPISTQRHTSDGGDEHSRNESPRSSSSPDEIRDVINDDMMAHDVRNGDVRNADAMNDVVVQGHGAFRGKLSNDVFGSYDHEMNENSDDSIHRGIDDGRAGKLHWGHMKEIMEMNEGLPRDNHDDEALVQRACAALKRADRLVRESCLERGLDVKERISASMENMNISRLDSPWSRMDKEPNHVNKIQNHVGRHYNLVDKTRYHVDKASLWHHPIDMSTPLVNDKLKNKPHQADAHVRRPLLDTDSYNNMLSSFANSKLGPRRYSPADEDLSRVEAPAGHSTDRVRHVSRTNGSLSHIGNYGTHNLTRDAYVYGRNGNGSTGKRFSWPPWHASRSRYRFLSERCCSPTFSSGVRWRSADERPRLRRSSSDDFRRKKRLNGILPKDLFHNDVNAESLMLHGV